MLDSAVESALESDDTELSEDIRAWHSLLMHNYYNEDGKIMGRMKVTQFE